MLDEPTIESRRIYDGRIIGVRVDTIRLPDGGTSQREIVEHGASVVCRAGGRAGARDPWFGSTASRLRKLSWKRPPVAWRRARHRKRGR